MSNFHLLNDLFEQLSQTQAKLLEIFETVPIQLFCVLEPGGIVQKLNPAWEQVVGWQVNQLEGRFLWDWLHPDDRAIAQAQLSRLVSPAEQAVEPRQSLTLKIRFRCVQPEYRWLLWHLVARSDGLLYATVEDVTEWDAIDPLSDQDAYPLRLRAAERQCLEESFSENSRLFCAVFVQNQIGMNWTDLTGRYLKVNQAFCQLVGYSEAELLNITFQSLTHPEDLEEELLIFDQLASGSIQEYSLEKRYFHRDGRVVWVSIHPFLVRNSDGVLEYIATIVQNISDRKQVEAELRKSEAKLAQAQRLANIGNWEIDLVTNTHTWSAESYRIFGVDPSSPEPTYTEFLERVHPDDRAAIVACDKQTIATKAPSQMEYRVIHPDGTIRYIEERQEAICDDQGNVIRLFGTDLDITERKQTELELQALNRELEQRVQQRTAELQQINTQLQAEIAERQRTEVILRESEARFRSYFSLPLIGIAITSPDRRWIEMNDKTCEMLGYSREELLQMTWTEVTHPEDLAFDLQGLDQLIRGQIDHYSLEKRYLRKDGSVIYVGLSIGAVRQPGNSLDYVVVLIQDITQRQLAKAALQESEQKFRQLAENISETFWLIKPDMSEILYISPAYEVMWGRSCESLYRNPQSWLEAVHPDDTEQVEAMLTRQVQGEVTEAEFRIVHPNGSIHWIWERSFPIWDESGRELLRCAGVSVDISDRKQAEEKIHTALLREQELNELKSRFISIVSHEFRTPLSTILSSTELLQRYGQQWSDSKKQSRYQRIVEAVDRMTEMLDDVLIIGKTEAGKLQCCPTSLNVVQFCQDLIEELQIGIGAQHVIQFTVEGDYLKVMLDEQLLRAILSNLLSNAIKYSAPGSTIQVDLSLTREVICFRIQDSGIGMVDAEKEQIFVMFQRGSNVGNISGTGLGMTIVKQCVDLHHGTITVDSTEGKGTTFLVTLPTYLPDQPDDTDFGH